MNMSPPGSRGHSTNSTDCQQSVSTAGMPDCTTRMLPLLAAAQVRASPSTKWHTDHGLYLHGKRLGSLIWQRYAFVPQSWAADPPASMRAPR